MSSSKQTYRLTEEEQEHFLSFYDDEIRSMISSSPYLLNALSKKGSGSPYFFALRYCNYGGVWYRARRRKWLIFSDRTHEPVDVLDLACYLFGHNANLQQFRKAVKYLIEEDLLISSGSKVYAHSVCSNNILGVTVYFIWRYWFLLILSFIIMGILALPDRMFAGALNGLYLMDGVFDFIGSSSLRAGTKFLLWHILWTLDRIFTPMFTPYTPLMSYGLLFIRIILVILSFRCASNKNLPDHAYIRIQNHEEWTETDSLTTLEEDTDQ